MTFRRAPILLIAVLCLFTVKAAEANQCDTPIDLRADVLPGVSSGDQGNTYACGFFAASTLLDSYHRGLGSIDPVALAIDLAADRDLPIWMPLQLTTDPLSDVRGRTGASICDIIRYARRAGVCETGDPRVESREFMKTRSNQAMAIYKLILSFYRSPSATEKNDLAQITKKIGLIVSATEGETKPHKISQIILENRHHPYRAIQKIFYPRCTNEESRRRFDDLPKCEPSWYLAAHSETISNAIQDRLAAPQALPVSVLHCFQVLREGRAFQKSRIWSADCIRHYSTVIGRRNNEGTCQFLIRNSYDSLGRKGVSPDWERSGQDFWVDAEIFSRSAASILQLAH